VPERSQLDSETLNAIDTIVEFAIKGKAMPGCQVLVAKDGKIVFEKSYGYSTYDSLTPVTDTTLYDIASVTKVVASTQAFMMLYDQGIFDLDESASTYLPELVRTNKENIYLRELLVHQGGLFPFIGHWKKTMKEEGGFDEKYYSSKKDKWTYDHDFIPGMYTNKYLEDSLWKWTIESRLLKMDQKTGMYPYRYSDLGYYFLKRLIEKNTNQQLEDFLAENLYNPLGMPHTLYKPLEKYPNKLHRQSEISTLEIRWFGELFMIKGQP